MSRSIRGWIGIGMLFGLVAAQAGMIQVAWAHTDQEFTIPFKAVPRQRTQSVEAAPQDPKRAPGLLPLHLFFREILPTQEQVEELPTPAQPSYPEGTRALT